MPILTIEHIVRDADKRNGRPRIRGTGITVKDIVGYHSAGWTVDYIAQGLSITAGQVYAALSYYYDHQAEIDEDIRQDEAFAEQALAQPDPRLEAIRQRMAALTSSKSE